MAESKALRHKRTTDGTGFEVYYEGGGQLPKELAGRFTDERNAITAIKRYQSKKPVKRKYNGSVSDK